MRIEAPSQTLERFAQDINWLSQPIETIAHDLKSSANESRHEWDAFYYEENNGHLFDPVRKQIIVGTDGGDLAQRKVNDELERWFLSNESGIAVRISPSGGKWNYPNEQIEIYRITYDFPSLKKKLFCSFRQFHANLTNPEKIRQFIFTHEDSEEVIFETIKWMEKKSRQEIEVTLTNEVLRSNQSYYYATMLKAGDDPRSIFENMAQTGFLGEYAIGCAGSSISSGTLTTDTAELTVTKNYESFDNLSGWHEGTCRICGISTWVGPCSICKSCESKL